MNVDIGLCQPSTAILLVAVAGTLYHLVMGQFRAMIWWIMVGLFGTGIFQALCFGGLEPIAWILMLIPVLIVCFFLAVALFASRMRIENVEVRPCDRCRHRHRGECPEELPRPGCAQPRCQSCGSCDGRGCPYCPFAAEESVQA